MRVVVAPDSMGGLLGAGEVAAALAQGWSAARPDDEIVVRPLSDGGEGLLDVVQGPDDTLGTVEVAGPLGHPVQAAYCLRSDGSAVVESARACGLALVPSDRRDPLRATTHGVGELLDAARRAGARRIVVGLGGSATVDGGAGALTGLGFRLRVSDGSGLKVGGADLHRVSAVEAGWRDPDWGNVTVDLLADVRTRLDDAARVFGPQKGADAEAVERLAAGLARWARVVARDLDAAELADEPGSGAAGGLGFGLAAALAGRLVPGAGTVADLVGLDAAIDGADLVITGEGALDATSFDGKVVGEVAERAAVADVAVAVVAGRVDVEASAVPADLAAIETAGAGDPDGAERAVASAAGRLAAALGDG